MTVLIPVIVSVIISCVMDLSCFVFIQHQRLSTTSNLINLDNLTEQPNVSVSPNNIFNLFSKKSSVHPTPPNLNPQVNTMEIPLRATIISTLLFIPYITAYAVMGIEKLDPLEKYFFVIILTRIQDTLRNPLIVKFLFNINDLNRQRNALEERERNQQREIQDALKRRQLRQEAKMTNDSRYHINISFSHTILIFFRYWWYTIHFPNDDPYRYCHTIEVVILSNKCCVK